VEVPVAIMGTNAAMIHGVAPTFVMKIVVKSNKSVLLFNCSMGY